MIRKYNDFKFLTGLIISIGLVVGYTVSVVLYGADSELSLAVIGLVVCLIMIRPKSELSILKRAYGKFEWFKDSDIDLIETGKIDRCTAYAIGKEKIESFPQGSKYIIVFADNSSKRDMPIKEYNKTFSDSNIAEVSEYLDNFAEYWRFNGSLKGIIKYIKEFREIKKSC